MRITTTVLIVLGTATMLLSSAWADSITVSDDSGSFNPNTGGTGYSIEDEVSGSFGSDISATEMVYQNNNACATSSSLGCGGALDFFVQVYNPLGSGPVDSVDLTGFSNYTASLGYITLTSNEVSPTGASLSASGVLSFDFDSLSGTSSWLEIQTGATSFATTGTIGINGNLLTSAAPSGVTGDSPVVPEPATTGLVAGALALMAIVARRKSTKTSA